MSDQDSHADLTDQRDALAAHIYDHHDEWLRTADGTPNSASYAAADRLLAAGFVPTDEPPTMVLAHQDTTTDDAGMYEWVAKEYVRTVRNVVRDLRSMADRLDRVTAPKPDQQNPMFGIGAAVAISDLMNGINGLGIDAIVRAAAEADTALLRARLSAAVSEAETLRANPGVRAVEPNDLSADTDEEK